MCNYPHLSPYTAYCKYGCRCSRCVQFYRDYKRENKRKQFLTPGYRERANELKRKYLQNILNYSKKLAREAARRGKERLVWRMLSEEDKDRIYKIYQDAKQLTEETGIEHHVDHIVPLSSGGLHHPDNLQILTKEENLQKATRLSHTHKDRIDNALRKIVEVYGSLFEKLSNFDKKL